MSTDFSTRTLRVVNKPFHRLGLRREVICAPENASAGGGTSTRRAS
jgi:hypothetical protein